MTQAQDVKQRIYEAVAKAAGDDFAFSYLIRAKQIGSLIVPHTWTAWKRISGNQNAMVALHDAGVRLKEPVPWHPNRDAPSIHRQAA